jgi:hypothetical protein
MNPHDSLDAAERTKNALSEHLSPAFSHVETVYQERLAHIAATEPWAVDKIRSLALALMVSREVRGYLEAIVANGGVAKAQIEHTRKIERMSPERRKILGI